MQTDAGVDIRSMFAEALRHHQAGHLAEAERLYRVVLKHKPDFAEAHCNRGAALQALGRADRAVESYQQAIVLNPNYFDAYNNMAVALQRLGRLDDALASCRRALALKSDNAEVHFNLGAVLQELDRPEEAILSYRRGLELKPNNAEVYFNLGVSLRRVGRQEEALASLNEALKMRLNSPELHFNLGATLQALGQLDEALTFFRRGIVLKADHAATHHLMGGLLKKLGRLEESSASFEEALKLEPGREYLYGDALHTRMQLCDWSDWSDRLAQILERIERGEIAALPFILGALTDQGAPLLKAAELTIKHQCPTELDAAAPPQSARRGKIRVGYFSSDFQNHPVGYAMAEIIEYHAKNDFEVFAFSLGPGKEDEIRRRVRDAADEFVDLSNMSDHDAALLARRMGIDIAVDLNGFTGGMRLGIFALRAAPIQVNYLGYSNSMGAEFIDYIIVDRTLVPDDHRQFYSEHLAVLPNSCLPKGPRIGGAIPVVGDKELLKQKAGLPDTGFVFCCFNNSYKIKPEVFDAWMRILNQVEGSVLWLREYDAGASGNLRTEALARGINADRLIFAGSTSEEEYMQRYCLADLFLDTWPYNAGSVARECLWAGLPILTLTGESYFSRMTASLLNVLELPELITSELSEYEKAAVRLAHDTQRLAQISATLAKNRFATPCFDTALLTRNVEKAYTQMYERSLEGSAPEDIFVANITSSDLG